MDISDLSDTIIAKSDQLNAEDLITGDRVLKVTNVVRYSHNGEQSFYLNYDGDDGRPYKPCLTMRRMIQALWGKDGRSYINGLIQVYLDPDVDYGKQKGCGGIRINGVSGIDSPKDVTLTVRRGIKKTYRVNQLQLAEKPPYPEDKFNAGFEAMKAQIQNGKMTTEQVINRCEASGKLSEQQRQMIRELDESEG